MGLVGAYNGLVRAIDGVVKAGCCCAPSTPDCNSYPLNWQATISGMLNKPNAPGLLAFPAPDSDVDGRIYCTAFGANYYSPFGYVPMDGTYVVPFTSYSSPTTTWSLSGLEYELWTLQNSGAPGFTDDIISLGMQDNTELTITTTGCVIGPGDVTISATITQAGASAGTVNAWSKTVTLSSGQKLLDLASIALDPVLPTNANSSSDHHGLNYPLDIPMTGCVPTLGSSPDDYPDQLILVPNP